MTSFDPQGLMTHSLGSLPEGDKIAHILSRSLARVEAGRCVRDHMARSGHSLHIAGREIHLERYHSVLLIGLGKAAMPMTRAAAEILDDHLTRGMVITKGGNQKIDPETHDRIEVFHGGHPYPNRGGVEASRAVLDLLQSTTEDDLVLFTISGGGSALLTAPAAGVSLEDLIRLNRILLECGATIQEINTVRKHLSQVKGGRLAAAAAPSAQISLILSDVVGDPIDMIASGPTVADPTTFDDALQVIEKYHLEHSIPSAVLAHLKNGTLGRVPESPKPGESAFEGTFYTIIGNNQLAAQAGVETAREAGFQTLHLTSRYQGEARAIGAFLGSVLQQMAATGDPLPRPGCLIAGGEATVTLQGGEEIGKGGRNQELALSAVQPLAGLGDVALVTLATDGNDGPTDAAGAVVTGESYQRGQALGLDPAAVLADHDSYHYFEKLGDLLQPGLTQTNVNDVVFLFTFKGS